MLREEAKRVQERLKAKSKRLTDSELPRLGLTRSASSHVIGAGAGKPKRRVDRAAGLPAAARSTSRAASVYGVAPPVRVRSEGALPTLAT